MPVQISVADVEILVSLNEFLHAIELMLQNSEVDLDTTVPPDPLLGAYGPVGAATDLKPQILDSPHHVHGNESRRVPNFQGSVNIKTD